MAPGEVSKVEQLIDHFMKTLSAVADEEDWKEADGWVGKWTITGAQHVTKIYEVRNGRFWESTPKRVYTGEVEMSVDTFLDVVDGAIHGKGEDVFADKYGLRAIRYRGEQWVVDSERFRKVLRRLGTIPKRALLG